MSDQGDYFEESASVTKLDMQSSDSPSAPCPCSSLTHSSAAAMVSRGTPDDHQGKQGLLIKPLNLSALSPKTTAAACHNHSIQSQSSTMGSPSSLTRTQEKTWPSERPSLLAQWIPWCDHTI
eukprot:GHVN01098432.1.p1 GENE.GHVN01098432.1~~GHVN01098432.1.p1  ORF type:complete len:122 (-),score=11.94 GHVN01098432.1:58-423(-)